MTSIEEIRDQERLVSAAEAELTEAKEEVKSRKEVLDNAIERLRRLVRESDQPTLFE